MARQVTRRAFVKNSVMGGLVAPSAVKLGLSGKDPYGGYRMCLATFGFRYFKGPEAVAMTKSLGVSYLDLWPLLATSTGGGNRDRKGKPYHENPEAWAELKAAMKKEGVQCIAYGVQKFGPDLEENRKLFEWAKREGIESFAAMPSPDSFDSLDKLVDEYNISVAIHNHGPTDKLYGKIQQVVDAVKDRHPLIGSCADLGHFWRANEDPIEALEALGKRVLSVHLKDQISETEQAVVGEGKMDLLGILKTLKKIGYKGALTLEYEDHPEDPVPHIGKCLENIRRMLAEIA